MSFFSAGDISRTGMSVQRKRMDIIAENIANANTTKTSDGGPYRRKIAIIAENSPNFMNIFSAQMGTGVKVDKVIQEILPPRMVYEPTNPEANEKGYVLLPNVNISTEMVDMMTATRAYEANVAAFNASKSMAEKALQIGS